MSKSKTPQRTHGSLEKGVRLLSAFLPDNKEMGIVELANIFSMNRSTVSRMLTVLKRQGLVLQNPESKKYSLGPLVANLAAAYRRSFQSNLTLLIKPYLDQLRNEIDHTVLLALPAQDSIILAYVTEGLGPLKLAAQVGEKRFYHTTAGGMCILAHSPENFIDTILQMDLPMMTPSTLVEPEEIRQRLQLIRERGFDFESEGNYLGICAFAVPILSGGGKVIAAVTVAGSTSTLLWEDREFYVAKLKKTAATLRTVLEGELET